RRHQLPDQHHADHADDEREEVRGRPGPRHPLHHTLPRAKPLAMWLRTNQIASAPGTMVSTPAAASTPQSMPAALTVRVMIAAIGLALVAVSVRASSSSTQLNMKQKKAVTPMPERISGRKTRMKKRGKL